MTVKRGKLQMRWRAGIGCRCKGGKGQVVFVTARDSKLWLPKGKFVAYMEFLVAYRVDMELYRQPTTGWSIMLHRFSTS